MSQRGGGNVLLLDEPTNDLDTETLRALEEAILDFPGSAMVTRMIAGSWIVWPPHILALEDDGEITFLEGNFQDYDADFKRRKGKGAEQPHRPKYKRLG